MPEPDILPVMQEWVSLGYQVNTHCIGDRANRLALDAYEAILSGTFDDLRLRVEHAQIIAPDDIARFARLGVLASMQPTHVVSDMGYAESRIGPERVLGAYAWRSLLDSGAHMPFGSDFPVEPVNPFLGIYAAVTRQDYNGEPFVRGNWLLLEV